MEQLPAISETDRNSRYLAKYGGREQFLALFHPAKQERFTRDTLRCIKGDAPTMQMLGEMYGDGFPQEWLVYQVIDLSEFCGVKEKINANQLHQLAELLTTEYANFKVTDFMLFFRRFKLGYYGQLYGAFDPLVITSKLIEFARERKKAINDYNVMVEKERQRKSRDERKGISHEEYLRLTSKKRKQ